MISSVAAWDERWALETSAGSLVVELGEGRGELRRWLHVLDPSDPGIATALTQTHASVFGSTAGATSGVSVAQLLADLELAGFAGLVHARLRRSGGADIPRPPVAEPVDLVDLLPPPRTGAPGDDVAPGISSYAVQLLDEHERPLTGVEIELRTPSGSQRVVTDGDGVAQAEAPPGHGTASVADVDALRQQLAQAHHGPARTEPLPEAPDLHVCTLGELHRAVTVPSAERQRILLLTRCDLDHDHDAADWGELSVDAGDAVAVAQAQDRVTIQIHADGLHRQLHVVGQAPPAIDYSPPDSNLVPGDVGAWEPLPPPVAPTWLAVDVDRLQTALAHGDLDQAAALLAQTADEPEDPAPMLPPPVVETLLVDVFVAARAIAGHVDPPMPADLQETPQLP